MKNQKLSRTIKFARSISVVLALTTALAIVAPAQTVEGIYGFYGYNFAYGGMIADSAGNLYGTTQLGGTGGCKANGCGSVFELSPAGSGWTLTTIYSFMGTTDGANPATGLAFDTKGNLYGTTPTTVFRLSPASGGGWTETTLHTFTGQSDGGTPAGPLVLDATGNLYGSTSYGGTLSGICGRSGCGVVYELSPNSDGSWQETVLHSFTGGTDGAYPVGGLTLADGDLYGAAYLGGNLTGCTGTGCGVVFELSPASSGWKETVLHSFNGAADGAGPQSGLAVNSAGNLFGTTSNLYTRPVAFKLSRSRGWKETILHSFTGSDDGSAPVGPLSLDAAGNVFGESTAPSWCNSFIISCGVVFKLSSSNGGWQVSALYKLGFVQPSGGLLLDAVGDIFGIDNGPTETGNSEVFEIIP